MRPECPMERAIEGSVLLRPRMVQGTQWTYRRAFDSEVRRQVIERAVAKLVDLPRPTRYESERPLVRWARAPVSALEARCMRTSM